ncbi:hypothetical protein [Bradyrhizobium sp. Tv2a-2]|uniref:hypothetical protein n=1 Tax=Bradyrhizobium sp. Tv2a-2 TaxID=113395 RepID=UPI00040A5DF3|nr:hypothetical protein [Bradyrhizobium sp. Tv2a-2]
MKRFLFAFGLWTNFLSLFALGTLKLTGVAPDWVPVIKDWAFNLVVINTMIMTAVQGYPALPDIKLPDGIKKALPAVLIVVISLVGLASTVRAADLPTKAKLSNPFAQPYDLTRCGAYFGFNAIGSTSSVAGNVQPGTQVVQGGLGGTVGYGCPINAQNGSFWFVEAMADITNINGATNGLSLSGPASFTERFGAGTPLNSVIGSILPAGSASPAVPSLPLLPTGITSGPGAPYAFVALHQDDISLSNGISQNREWLLSWGIGLGLRYRLSNGVVADTFAEYKAATQSICVGAIGNAACIKPDQGARVGISFLY